ncbi:MAG: hypothetical protein ACKOZZ_18075 [Bacteroidota bacterium]
MKTTSFLITLIYFSLFSCAKQTDNNDNPTLQSYFERTMKGIQTGGVQIIPLIEGTDTFSLWTKRIGNNPKIKVLLLNGGPGATHEYFECFENFLPNEGIEFIIMTSWEQGAPPILMTPPNGILQDMLRKLKPFEKLYI